MVTGLRGLRSRLLEIREYLQVGRRVLGPGLGRGSCAAIRLGPLQRMHGCHLAAGPSTYVTCRLHGAATEHMARDS